MTVRFNFDIFPKSHITFFKYFLDSWDGWLGEGRGEADVEIDFIPLFVIWEDDEENGEKEEKEEEGEEEEGEEEEEEKRGGGGGGEEGEEEEVVNENEGGEDRGEEVSEGEKEDDVTIPLMTWIGMLIDCIFNGNRPKAGESNKYLKISPVSGIVKNDMIRS